MLAIGLVANAILDDAVQIVEKLAFRTEIETVELATTLATLGCASGQGFYFAKALEADAALEYWKSRRR